LTTTTISQVSGAKPTRWLPVSSMRVHNPHAILWISVLCNLCSFLVAKWNKYKNKMMKWMEGYELEEYRWWAHRISPRFWCAVTLRCLFCHGYILRQLLFIWLWVGLSNIRKWVMLFWQPDPHRMSWWHVYPAVGYWMQMTSYTVWRCGFL
jgi:hypothetical protein